VLRIAYLLKVPRKGRTHRVMTPMHFMARLAALIPTPWVAPCPRASAGREGRARSMTTVDTTEHRDPRYIERLIRIAGPTVRRWFRPEVRGLEGLGPGPCLIVANHNIAAPWEIYVLLEHWVQKLGPERAVYGLAHRFGFRLPGVSSMLRRIGAIPATHQAAHEALAAGAAVIVFPGGNDETARPFSRRDRCDLGGHKGWARIALEAGVPVVPVSIVGSHAVNPVLASSELLAWVSLVRPVLHIRRLPVTVAQLLTAGAVLGAGAALHPPWAAIALAFIGLTSTAAFFPLLPSKIEVRVNTPIDPRQALPAEIAGEAAVDALYDLVVARMQAGMDALVAERRGILGRGA
jgi:1-acyl-sn-glycerol-3-phosphate acyltransferase